MVRHGGGGGGGEEDDDGKTKLILLRIAVLKFLFQFAEKR
jgi:hypothetical protein